MNHMHRLAPDAAHGFGGTDIDRSKPLAFRLNGQRVRGFAGDSVMSAVLAAGIDEVGEVDGAPLALTGGIAPLAAGRREDQAGLAVPLDRLPATDGADYLTVEKPDGLASRMRRRNVSSLHLRLDAASSMASWLEDTAGQSLSADLLVVGGGVAGLCAAEAAAAQGRSVILVERRAWLGGDARYFGAVGDEETPDAVTRRLSDALARQDNVTVLTGAEVHALNGGIALVRHVALDGDVIRTRTISIEANRIVLATGAAERLPIFAGNRLPGVLGGIEAYHLAKRFGVGGGPRAVVVTQNNFGYRLALRLHDAGVRVARIVDPRINPQSRFIDFAKASGLTLGSGQITVRAERLREGLHLTLAPATGTGAGYAMDTPHLVVSGVLQPRLDLWMMAGGGVRWENGRLAAFGPAEGVALAGSAAGFRSMVACMASGRAAVLGKPKAPIADPEPDAAFETPETFTPIAPATPAPPAYLDRGRTLMARAHFTAGQLGIGYALSLGDVAALTDIGAIAPTDAGAVAEERRATGGQLVPSAWRPRDDHSAQLFGLADRFGPDPATVHLVVDGKRRFDRGALVYANTGARVARNAVGVIVDGAATDDAGGMALVSRAALARSDRFIVETLRGPSPARPKRSA